MDWRQWLSNSENQKLLANVAMGGMAAYGANQDRKYNQEQDALNRGDSLFDKQRASYLGRANSLNDLSQTQLDDQYRGATQAADIADPFAYKDSLYRDATRSQVQGQIGKMLGMSSSPLLSSLNNSVLDRNASAVYNRELDAQDINPNRSARDLSTLLGGQNSPLLSSLNSSLSNYANQSNQNYDQTRAGMVANTQGAYDQVDASLKAQLADPKIDPNTGEKKKTSTWRKVLGGVVKYGVPIALAATGVGIPAAMAMSAGGSFVGDKIAGKSTKDSILGAAAGAIPGGTGAVGSGLTKGITNQVLKTAANQGLKAAAENVPGVGMGLMAYNALGGNNASVNSNNSPMVSALQRPQALSPQMGLGQNINVNRQNLLPVGATNANLWRNVRFPHG